MAGILFLRDIDVDIQMRCRNCGHEGLLARGDLERRFGPSYPVLSIAPHYRCSRCHSKDVESSPGPLADPPPDLHASMDEGNVGAGLAALQGLLDAVRGDRPAAGKDAVEEDEDDVVDLMPQIRGAEADVEDVDAEAGTDADDDLFERTMASLRTVAHPERDDDEDVAQAAPEPEPEPEPVVVEEEDEEDPFDRSLAALRDLIGDEAITDDDPANDEPPEDASPEPSPERAPADARAVIAEIIESDDEDEGQPFFRPRESAPPSASEMELSLAALRALVEKAAEDTPPPELEPDAEPEPEEPEPFAPAEPEPAAHGDDEPFDETIAALRSLIADRHRDADEDEDEPLPDDVEEPVEDEPESLDDISESEILSFAIRDPDLPPDEETGGAEHAAFPAPALPEEPPPAPVPPARTSHLNETLAKLRGMLELDRPNRDPDGEPPPHRPRRR